VTRRNKAWVTDITYIRTWQGWLYLAGVMDLFSRKIVGWSAGPSIHRELVLDLEPSMSRKVNCWDNAVAESFFSSLKTAESRGRSTRTERWH
jgi:putative transposase